MSAFATSSASRPRSPISTRTILDSLIDALEPMSAEKGEIVVRQGEASDSMFFVEEGRLRAVWQTEDGSRGDVAYIRRGDFFGERSLLLGAPRAVSIEAVTPAKLLVLHEPDFRRLIEADAGFKAVVNREVERYEFKFVARVPLDFAEELVPAEAAVAEPVGLDQVDAPPPPTRQSRSGRRRRGSRPGESGSSPTCGRSTRWTAAPPVSPWSPGTSAGR